MTQPTPTPDIRGIALTALKERRRSGESQEMCARWIAERVREALSTLPDPVPDVEAQIVAWLRSYTAYGHNSVALMIADAIEAGEHRGTTSPPAVVDQWQPIERAAAAIEKAIPVIQDMWDSFPYAELENDDQILTELRESGQALRALQPSRTEPPIEGGEL